MKPVKNKLHPKSKKCEKESPWLVTYADLMTVLFALFILLVGVSKFDQSKYDLIRQSVTREKISKRENEIKHSLEKKHELMERIRKAIKNSSIKSKSMVIENEEGVKIIFPDKALFKTAQTKLDVNNTRLLKSVYHVLSTTLNEKSVYLKISGYTDDIPISKGIMKSNWNLSGERAASVANYFETLGIPKGKMSIEGYADTRPLVILDKNDTKEILCQKRAMNRRVELQIDYKKKEIK